jgi:drug/metabolite transporter (DMT)-like permease
MSAVATAPGKPLSPLVLACLAATWLIWGSTYLAIKFALISFPPFVQMGSRFLLAGGLLLAWCRWRGETMPTSRQWGHAAVIGALMLGGGMGCTAYAERTVSSGLVVAFIAVVPVIMALLSLAWRVYPNRLETIGIALGLFGVLLLARGSGFQASASGLALQTLACFAWSLGSVLSQRVLPLAAGATGFASEMICGGVLLLAMAVPTGEYPVASASWPPQPVAVAAWVYLVVAGSLLAFNAYMVLLARAPVTLASSYCFVNPVIAMVLGMAVLGEQVTDAEWAATLVTLAGVVTLLMGRQRHA